LKFAGRYGDGDADLFIGNSSGKIFFHENTGTPARPEWQPVDRNYLNLGGFGVSFDTCEPADMDLDGGLNALFGDGDGKFYHFWNAGTFPTGVYFCRLRADGRTDTRKMLLLK
jgi:hypothetical protein